MTLSKIAGLAVAIGWIIAAFTLGRSWTFALPRESDRVGHVARHPALSVLASSGTELAVIAGPPC